MEIKTFDTILTGLCDSFDSLISPRSIARTNIDKMQFDYLSVASRQLP